MDNDGTPRDRHGIEVLSPDECRRLLAAGTLGRVAYVDAGTPVIAPVNYALDGTNVVFRSSVGTKLDAAERGRPFAFEIDDHDPDTRTGWSVLVTGIVEPVDDPAEVGDALPQPYAFDDDRSTTLLRLRAETISGRRIGPTAPA